MAVEITSIAKGASSSGSHWYKVTVENDSSSAAYFALKQGSYWQTLYGNEQASSPSSSSYPNGGIYVAAYDTQYVWIKLEQDDHTYTIYVWYKSSNSKVGSTGTWSGSTQGNYKSVTTDSGTAVASYKLTVTDSTSSSVTVKVTGGSSGDGWNLYCSTSYSGKNNFVETVYQSGSTLTYKFTAQDEAGTALEPGTTYYFIAKHLDDSTNSNKAPGTTLPTSYTYYLVFDANGGSGAPSSKSKTSSNTYYTFDLSNYSLSEPTRSGYRFLGWGTSSSSSSTTNYFTAYKSSGYEVTAYAVWEKLNTFYLVFDANGGSGAPANKTATSSASYYTFYLSSYSLATPTRSGYSFVGWGTSSSSTVAATSFTAYQSSGYSVTAYAIWEKTASALVPNITSLTTSDVSSSSFRVSATQDNLTSGYWRIEISTSSSFSSIDGYSNSVGYLQSTLSYTFSGLSANTRYYIRIRNEYNGDYEYATGWSRYTGIVQFAWTSSDSTAVVSGQPVKDAITAEKWNLLQKKISQVSVRNGNGSVSLSSVAQGATMTANAFNAVRNAMAALSNVGSVPSVRSKGDTILAAYFANSTASLKSAINRAIEALND